MIKLKYAISQFLIHDYRYMFHSNNYALYGTMLSKDMLITTKPQFLSGCLKTWRFCWFSDDFEPSASDASDDEETIDKEERQAKGSKVLSWEFVFD